MPQNPTIPVTVPITAPITDDALDHPRGWRGSRTPHIQSGR